MICHCEKNLTGVIKLRLSSDTKNSIYGRNQKWSGHIPITIYTNSVWPCHMPMNVLLSCKFDHVTVTILRRISYDPATFWPNNYSPVPPVQSTMIGCILLFDFDVWPYAHGCLIQRFWIKRPVLMVCSNTVRAALLGIVQINSKNNTMT